MGKSSPAMRFYGGFYYNWSMWVWWVAPYRTSYTLTVPQRSIGYTLKVKNNPPNPPSISGPAQGYRNTTYDFSVRATDPDGDNIRYEIDWDNNGTVDERIVGGAYIPNGEARTIRNDWSGLNAKTFAVRAIDNQGGIGEWRQHTITIANRAPIMQTLSGSSRVSPNISTSFRWSATDQDGDTLTYEVDWGDGSAIPSTTHTSVTVRYPRSGAFTVRVRAKDAYDGVSEWKNMNVAVENAAPTITSISGHCVIGSEGSVRVSAHDPELDNIYYRYTVNDGAQKRSPVSSTVLSDATHNIPLSCNSTDPLTAVVRAVDTYANVSAPKSVRITPSSPCPHCIYNGGDPLISLSVTPTLVKKGEQTTLSWSIENAINCSVTGGGMTIPWDTVRLSQSAESTAINQETRFTLSCEALDGTAVSDIVRVRIAPSWQEI